MKRKILKEDSPLGKQIQEIEELMDKYGIVIDGNYLTLLVNNKSYRIGRDQCRFPRFVDEPFVLVEE